MTSSIAHPNLDLKFEAMCWLSWCSIDLQIGCQSGLGLWHCMLAMVNIETDLGQQESGQSQLCLTHSNALPGNTLLTCMEVLHALPRSLWALIVSALSLQKQMRERPVHADFYIPGSSNEESC